MCHWLRWGPEPILVQEGPPWALLTEAPMEVEGISATLVQEDSASVENDVTAE